MKVVTVEVVSQRENDCALRNDITPVHQKGISKLEGLVRGLRT